MAGLLELLSSSGRPPVWLDYVDYAGALLARGKIPWLDVTAYVAWQRQAQGLLKSDVVPVPLEPAVAAWLAVHPELTEAMGAKKRTVAALRTLLADEALRGHLVDLTKTVRVTMGGKPMALCLPSPRRWVALAYAQAFPDSEAPEVSDDDADSASVYMADFLRLFGEAGVDVLLLEEAAGSEPASAEALKLYQSVLNVGAHYRWQLGLALPVAASLADTAGSVAFSIAPKAIGGGPTGLWLPDAFWTGTEAPTPPAGGFRYARIPADAKPETVLERLATLR